MRFCALLLVLGCAVGQDIPDHPDQLTFKPIRFDVPDPDSMRSVLSNGMVVYALEDDALPLVEISFRFHGGSIWDPPGKEGLAQMLGTLMRTGGTRTRAPREIDEELEFLDASISVSLGTSTGSATLSVMKKDLDRGLELLVDILRNPAFDQEKLDLEKARLLDVLKSRNDHTATIEAREVTQLLYGDHPLTRQPTKKSVESITREDLAAVHEQVFWPGNFIVAASGAFRRDELLRKLEQAFAGWPNRNVTFEIPPVTHKPPPGVYCFHKEGKNINQGRVTMAHLGIDIHHPDVHAVRLMSYIYGAGGFSSRLMGRVRSEEGLAYDVRSDFSPGIQWTGTMRIEFQSKSETCAYAAKLCLEELAKIQKEGVSPKELEDAKKFYLEGFPGFFFKTRAQTVSTFANAELQGIPKDYYRTYRERIAKVTLEDIKRVANEHLKPEQFVIVVVGDCPTIKKGNNKAKLEDLGTPIDVPLPDPLTLERPK